MPDKQPTLAFEKLPSKNAEGVDINRAKIPGGWLVSGLLAKDDWTGYGITFVPDPEHSWDGASVDSGDG